MVEEIEREDKRETHLDRLPIKRKGKPEEVASLIAFLLGDESQYITGSIYSIDGGWNI
jgi:NAD(P)-dependent dehydrogenase (short-subunit alcohol dehydrogenase family)